MTDVLAEKNFTSPRLPSPQVWLKSEFLDLKNELHFDAGPSDYDSASWPLRKFGSWRDSQLVDSTFDWNVRNAWKLPWQFWRTRLERCEFRDRANFVIRHIGHWNGDGERYGAVLSTLIRRLRGAAGRPTRLVLALTPFSIIAQNFGEPAGNEVAHTEILFFYTFDSFVQEALASNAHAGGVAPDKIVGAYEHLYVNTRPGAVLLRDPAELRLAALTTPNFSWTGIRDHLPPRGLNRMGGIAEDRPLDLRERLFRCRLQTHLMVAIAVACHGIASFEQPTYSSPVVALAPAAPKVGELAPFWLRHVLGAYDYADACMRLLDSLARCHGQDVKLHANGSIIPGGTHMRTDVEESVGLVISPFGHDDMASGDDPFRFGIFNTAIDNDALTTWDEDVRRTFVQRRGH
jgi:hypothetical protein